MKSIVKAFIISAVILAIHDMAPAQTGAWIEHTFTPFGTGPQRYACGESVAGFTYTNSNIILFFDINTSRWLEVDLQSTQHFYDLIAQGDIVFAFSDSFIVAYNGRNGSCSIRRYEGTPLNIDGNGMYERSYACGDKMAMFITDSFMYIFDIELDTWLVFDYSMPANFADNGFYWINNDYAAGVLNCSIGATPTNIVYSLQTHSFNETPNGVSNYYGTIAFKMDNGFAGMYTTETSKYLVGYSAASNQFSSITVNVDYTLESSSLSSYSYVDEYTVYAAKSRYLITPHEDVRIEFYCYDTRLGNWTTMIFHADPDVQSDPMSWMVGGRQATCLTAWNTDDNLRRIYVYSGYTGEIQSFNPGIFYNSYDHIYLVGENSFLISDTSRIWAHNAETGQSSFHDVHKDWNRNYMGGKNFLTFTRRDTYGDSSNTYIYYAPDNNWRVIYNTESTMNNSIMGSYNGFVFRTYGDTPKMILYSAIQDEIVIATFPEGWYLGLFINQNIIVGTGGETKLFDLRTAELLSFGTSFGNNGLGTNAAISDDINTNTLYGYSAYTGNITELQTNETPHVYKAINYVGLAYVSSILRHFYMFNSFHDNWVELDLGSFAQGGVGGKTALLYITDAVYAFDPEILPTAVDDENTVAPIPSTYSMAQNYPNPFNARTIIKYNLSNTSEITIDIFNILGRKVETLVEAEMQAGQHQVIWDASDYSSGLYFYRIELGNLVETKQMLLLK